MATTTFHEYTGDGSDKTFDYSFPTYFVSEVKVQVDGVEVDNYTVPSYATTGTKTVTFDNTTGSVNSTVCEASGAPKTGLIVRVYRDTTIDAAKHTFQAGDSVKAGDLNTNQEQILRALQEQQFNTETTADYRDNSITGAKIKNDAIDSQHYAADSIDTEHYAPLSVDTAALKGDAVNGDKIANLSIDSEHYVVGSIDTAHLADDAVNADKLADDSVETDRIKDLAVTEGKLANESVTSAKIANATITAADIANDTITGDQIATSTIKTSNLKPDAVGASQLADTAVTAGSYTTADITVDAQGRITAASNGAIGTTEITDDAVTYAKIQNVSATDRVLGRDSSGAGIIEEITPANLRTMINVEDGATADQNATEIKSLYESNSQTNPFTDSDKDFIADITATATEINVLDGVTASTAELNMMDNCTAVGTELSVLDGITANTSELNILDGVTSSTAELNLLDGKSVVTTIAANATDVQIPSAQAVNERIVTVMQDAGGFVPIANEVSFPNTNPDPNDDAGTIVSIADAGGLKVADGSGSGTYAGTAGHSLGATTAGGTAVTITGIDSSLQGTTIAAGKGMLVETTSTLNTYTYHRLVVDEAGVAAAQTLVNDFNQRYRVGSSNPTSSLDDGDLFFNTTSDKMLVYNATGSSWDEVQSVGNFFINTLSSLGASNDTIPGGSATPNGTAKKFTLSNPGTYAQQHIVSINGVIQKPNPGTSVPSEGFAIDGSAIIFSDAPASGSDYFIITVGASVNIGAPSNNTVTSASIVDGSIVNADVSSSAAIAGSKLADDSIAEVKLDISNTASDGQYLQYKDSTDKLTWASVSTDLVADTSPQLGGDLDTNSFEISLDDSHKIKWGDNDDLQIYHDGSHSYLKDAGDGQLRITSDSNIWIEHGAENMIVCKGDDAVELYYDNSKKFETSSGGGTLTGNWICTNDFKLDNSSNAGKDVVWNASNNRLRFEDSVEAAFGDGEDLKIFHNGTRSKIQNNTGDLRICGNDIKLKNYDDDETYITCAEDGSVELYYDNSKKAFTGSTGFNVDGNCDLVSDNNKLQCGADADLQIYHDGSNNILKNNNCDTYIQPTSNGETAAIFKANGAVELYYDNNKKFQTGSEGIFVYGAEGGDGVIRLCADEGDDNADYWKFNSAAVGGFFLENYTSGAWETNIKASGNGAVELYYDNDMHLSTSATGCFTNGSFSFRTDSNVEEILYDQANGKIRFNDSKKANFGSGDDLQIYHNGTDSYIDNNKNTLYIRNNVDDDDGGNIVIQTVSGEHSIVCKDDDSVDLYYDGAKKFETRSYGVKQDDDVKHTWGNNDDLQIYHDGTNSVIINNTAELYQKTATNMHLRVAGDEKAIAMNANGAVELYHDNTKKFETTANGATITGHLSGGHSVLEQFFTVCDGSTIALVSGNKTVQDVTDMMDLSTTFEDLTGSTLAYTPPTGTKQVIYEFHFMVAHKDANGIASCVIYLDSDEVTQSKTCYRGDVFSTRAVMKWAFNIGGSADTDVGRVASWTSDKTIKMQINNYSGSNECYAHRLVNYGTSTTDIYPAQPCIGITAIG